MGGWLEAQVLNIRNQTQEHTDALSNFVSGDSNVGEMLDRWSTSDANQFYGMFTGQTYDNQDPEKVKAVRNTAAAVAAIYGGYTYMASGTTAGSAVPSATGGSAATAAGGTVTTGSAAAASGGTSWWGKAAEYLGLSSILGGKTPPASYGDGGTQTFIEMPGGEIKAQNKAPSTPLTKDQQTALAGVSIIVLGFLAWKYFKK